MGLFVNVHNQALYNQFQSGCWDRIIKAFFTEIAHEKNYFKYDTDKARNGFATSVVTLELAEIQRAEDYHNRLECLEAAMKKWLAECKVK